MEAQRELVFDRSERMRILRAADVPRAVANLIEAIEFSPPRPSWALLAAKMRVDRSTVHRTLRKAEAMEVVGVVPHENDNGRQQEHSYRINWERLADMPRPSREPRSRTRNPLLFGGLQNATGQSHFATSQSQNATVRQLQNATPISTPLINTDLSTSPSLNAAGCAAVMVIDTKKIVSEEIPSNGEADMERQPTLFEPSAKVAAADAPFWDKARTRLVQCGVSAASKAIEMAKERGWSPGGVLAICEHFLRQRGAWEPWVIYTRIKYFDPETPADANWPEKSKDFLDTQRREQQLERALKQTRTVTATESRRIDERNERARLEARYGPRLDALDAEALAAEVAQVKGGDFLMRASGRKGAMLRWEIFQRWKLTEGEACERHAQSATT